MLKNGQIKRIVAALLVFVITFSTLLIFEFSRTMAYTEQTGTVNGTNVNVRVGAGTSYSKLQYKGKNVQLNVGDAVKIIGEANASDGSLWYNIRFDYNGGAQLIGYMHSAYVDVDDYSYTEDTDFEEYMNKQGFPESYKAQLRKLHAKYPNWVFVADHVNYDWETVVENESLVGRSLVSKNSISSWKSLDYGSYNWETGQWATFDGSAWCAASEELVAYSMDPRNFLDETYIFQFELLSFNATIHKIDNVKMLLSGSFMDGAESVSGVSYAQTFMDAAAQSGVSPYHLVSRVIQEVGSKGTSGSVTGYYAPSTGNVYKNLFNFYNIGAYASGGRGAVENGLIYASKTDESNLRPWNTKYKAIVGGAMFIGKGYINVGQDTIYYEKFDLVGTPYTHQYMTNIQAPKSEAAKMSKAYSNEMKKNISLVFKIPVYKNMPDSACPCPTGDGSPNNVLEKLVVSGYELTPTFSKFTEDYDLIVPNNVSSIGVSATALDGGATISGTGTKTLKVGANTIEIVVTASNGSKRTYTINVVRKEAENTGNQSQPTTTQKPTETTTQPTTQKPAETTTQPTTTKPQATTPSYSTSYNKVDDIYISGIAVGTTAETIKKSFTLNNCTVQIYKSDGVTVNSGNIGTGNKVQIKDNSGKVVKEYTCVIYGDVNGNGEIEILDLVYVKRALLGVIKLDGASAKAADVNKRENVDILDLVYVKRALLGVIDISQK